jgi:Domain of unknown function (DUF4259)
VDWNSLRETLQDACNEPGRDDVAERAVQAAEIVASAAGEPPDELPFEARVWVELHGVPDEDLVELAVRAMKCIANASESRHDGLNDLRFRLGDIAAA